MDCTCIESHIYSKGDVGEEQNSTTLSGAL